LKACYVTHRPSFPREQRLIASLRKTMSVRIVKPWRFAGVLSPSPITLFKLASIGVQVLPLTELIVLDNVTSLATPMLHRKKVILEYSVPLSVEIDWLGHKKFALLAFRAEAAAIRHSKVTICPNDLMARRCLELGAARTFVIPNYPMRSFKASVAPETWRRLNGLPADGHFALFVGGGRMREIYGLEMMLESWKIVEEAQADAWLIIVGPLSFDWTNQRISALGLRRVKLVGWQNGSILPNWIGASDVCLAPRTPGFPRIYYNDQDSTKIPEYAALSKPIVAAGYAPSSQYLLVECNDRAFAEGILHAFEGRVPQPAPHFWEEVEPILYRAVEYASRTR